MNFFSEWNISPATNTSTWVLDPSDPGHGNSLSEFLHVLRNGAVAGASIPLTPWSKVPLPLPLPFPLPSLPLPLEVGPLIAARESGGAL